MQKNKKKAKTTVQKNSFDAELMFNLLNENVKEDRGACFRRYIDLDQRLNRIIWCTLVDTTAIILLTFAVCL